MSHPRLLALALATVAACSRGETPPAGDTAAPAAETPPDEPPRVLNNELPFRYPPALYARKVQGNVTLRLFVDRDGNVLADSTRVEESSTISALDSAAVQGSHQLRFAPAKSNGLPVSVPVLFPVYFRHPDALPLPGDTVLGTAGGRRAAGAAGPTQGTTTGVRTP